MFKSSLFGVVGERLFLSHSLRKCNLADQSIYTSMGLIGQPHFGTHPHLLKPNEVTKGILKEEHEQRRKSILSKLPNNSLMLLIANTTKLMSNDIPYPYKQHSNVVYTSGFQEPESVLVLSKFEEKEDCLLFVRPQDKSKEIWDGPRAGKDIASILCGIDKVYLNSELEKKIGPLLSKSEFVFCDPTYDENITSALKAPNYRLHQERLIKSDSEIKLMKEAADIAAFSMKEVMAISPSINTEHNLAAEMEYRIKKRGAQRHSYPPVVAGGKNALILHYVNNDQIINDGDLILMDSGAEFHDYASDITRTWPKNGKFTKPQRELYDLVLQVNLDCIALCKVGNRMTNIQSFAAIELTKGLIKLGILQGSLESNIKAGTYSKFYPHNIGHWLGMDTHDCGTMTTSMPLQKGMTLTIEPGLYIPFEADVPEQYKGIGIRIEDNIVILDSGCEVLTNEVPKDPEEIENLIK